MPLSLTLLGTNGFVPAQGRHTMSFLVEADGRALLLDAGTGVGRLLVAPLAERVSGLDHLEVLLTHFHLDHTVGLSYLPAFWTGKRVTLHVPRPPLVDVSGEEALARLLAPPLFPLTLEEFPMTVEVAPYSGDRLEVAGLEARVRRQRHDGGSVGVVLADRLAYLTDCEAEEQSARFAAGAELLLHEVWVSDEEVAAGAHRKGHSTVEEVARLARQAGVRRLLPIHHRPARPMDEVEAFVARLRELSGVDVVLGREGETYEV